MKIWKWINSMDEAGIGMLALAGVVLIAGGAMVWQLTAIPVVYWSHSDDVCVRVETTQGEGSCNNLPHRYSKVWVL